MSPPEKRDPRAAARIDPRTRTALIGVAGFGIIFAIAAGAGWGLRPATSVSAGALIAVLNLYGLARILGGALGARTGSNPDAGLWGLFAVFKVVALFGGVWLLMRSNLVDPIPLVVGWCALPVGIAAGSLTSDKTDPETAPRGNQAPPGPPVR